jgi:predicted protein tyrosine phosphatase
MTHNEEAEVGQIGIRLLDDAYVAWLTAESESERALHFWFEQIHDHSAAYLAYVAALDREHAAAYDLQRLSALVTPHRRILTSGENACAK